MHRLSNADAWNPHQELLFSTRRVSNPHRKILRRQLLTRRITIHMNGGEMQEVIGTELGAESA